MQFHVCRMILLAVICRHFRTATQVKRINIQSRSLWTDARKALKWKMFAFMQATNSANAVVSTRTLTAVDSRATYHQNACRKLFVFRHSLWVLFRVFNMCETTILSLQGLEKKIGILYTGILRIDLYFGAWCKFLSLLGDVLGRMQ